jgi:hypothetical protein
MNWLKLLEQVITPLVAVYAYNAKGGAKTYATSLLSELVTLEGAVTPPAA